MATPVTKRIVEVLRKRRGEFIETNDLLNAIYGDREDGGPEYAAKILHGKVHYLRAQGIPIRRVSGYTLD
jgi:hypothetical protein